MNENLIASLEGIENFSNLKELQINFNQIEKIQNLDKLVKLEKFWICENKVKKIENLPASIINFWAAFNLLEKLDSTSFSNLYQITELNLAGNFLSSFNDLHVLSKLEKLNILSLSDPNFGENPICLINNYRNFLFHKIPQLTILDEITITKEEINENRIIISKKNSFYKNKIKQMNRISKSCFNMLKNFNFFYKTLKLYQIEFFRSRIKMLEYLKFERKIIKEIPNENKKTKNIQTEKEPPVTDQNLNNSKHGNIDINNAEKFNQTSKGSYNKSFDIKRDLKEEIINNKCIIKTSDDNPHELDDYDLNKRISTLYKTKFNMINSDNFSNSKNKDNPDKLNISVSENFGENPSEEEFCDEINAEIELLNNKINQALENIKSCDNNYKIIKNFISEVNDFSIIW